MRPCNALCILWVVVVLACAGCAGLAPVAVGPVAPGDPFPQDTAGWWAVRIRWQWPEDAEPAWHLDLLAAHQIFLPILNDHGQEIRLWRVHRRARRDAAGHQFSLIFFAGAQTAASIRQRLSAGGLPSELSAAGLMADLQVGPAEDPLPTALAGTSDPAWTPELQAAWPYYIQGVSRMWLLLVSATANRLLPAGRAPTLAETLSLYQRVDEEVTRTWQQEGRHAMLHHLNAVFGYRPLMMIERRWLQF